MNKEIIVALNLDCLINFTIRAPVRRINNYRNISLKYDIKYTSKVDLMKRYVFETLRMYSLISSVLWCSF